MVKATLRRVIKPIEKREEMTDHSLQAREKIADILLTSLGLTAFEYVSAPVVADRILEALTRTASVDELVEDDALNGAINVELLNRVRTRTTALEGLMLAAGELNAATDGVESLRPQRKAVLDALNTALRSITRENVGG